MYIESVPNRNAKPTVLLRESRREGSRIVKITLANLLHWPSEKVEAFRLALKKQPSPVQGSLPESFDIVRSLPHGHVACILGTLKKTGLDTLIGSKPSRNRELTIAMLVQRIIDPGSKLSAARALNTETQTSSLATLLDLEEVSEGELYQTLDWLLKRQRKIDRKRTCSKPKTYTGQKFQPVYGLNRFKTIVYFLASTFAAGFAASPFLPAPQEPAPHLL